jgi:hypothetical protein
VSPRSRVRRPGTRPRRRGGRAPRGRRDAWRSREASGSGGVRGGKEETVAIGRPRRGVGI